MDGAGEWRTLFRIVVPCAVPVLATLVLFTSVGYWNEFFQGWYYQWGTVLSAQTYIKQMVVNVQTTNLSMDQIETMDKLSNKSLDAAKVFISIFAYAGSVSVPAEIFRERHHAGGGERVVIA